MVKILRWLQQPHGGTAWCLQPLPSSQMPRGLCKIPTWEHPGISPAQRAFCRHCSVYVVLGRPQSIPVSFLPASIRDSLWALLCWMQGVKWGSAFGYVGDAKKQREEGIIIRRNEAKRLMFLILKEQEMPAVLLSRGTEQSTLCGPSCGYVCAAAT